MISTSCITGTGFMKCIPMTCPGRFVFAAISVIEMELVLVARIVAGPQSASSDSKILNLIAGFSLAASTTSAASFTAARSVAGAIRFRVAAASTPVRVPFFTTRAREPSMAVIPLSSAVCCTSTRMTSFPWPAKTWAMPLPMVPAPMTAIFVIRRSE